MNQIAKPKLDLVFKKIFGDVNNTDLLIDFLASVLDFQIDSIKKVELFLSFFLLLNHNNYI